jgi:hypothetical protein
VKFIYCKISDIEIVDLTNLLRNTPKPSISILVEPIDNCELGQIFYYYRGNKTDFELEKYQSAINTIKLFVSATYRNTGNYQEYQIGLELYEQVNLYYKNCVVSELRSKKIEQIIK